MEPFTLEPPKEHVSRDDRRRALENRAREISGDGVLFNEASWQLVLDLIEEGYTIEEINDNENLPSWSTIRRWIRSTPERIEQYRASRELSTDYLESQLLGIVRHVVDKDEVPVARLKTDTIKWIMSKRAPKNYGDKSQMDNGPVKEQEQMIISGGLPEMPE